ncbi:MAG: type II and III secretion system protein, partial [Candidatus Omnitrophica bacterium]|nr:type II and III secretion system protein [Candidatus Omnitrophota bacterium]
RMDIGTKLKVTPHVNRAGEITLEIEPEVSRAVTSSTAVSGAVDKLKRTAKTVVIVKDGNTVIIAGLISTRKEDTIHNVPFLGSIPILGNLFKYEKEVDNQTELIVFITPRIVRYWEKSAMFEEAEEYIEGEALQLEPIVVD